MHRTTIVGFAAILASGLSPMTGVAAASDVDDVKAAEQAFHVALSAMDGKAMAGIWANKPYVANIGPGSQSVAVGYADAVTHWMASVVPGRYSELKAQMTSFATIQVNGDMAWVVGVENASGKNKAGEPVAFDLLVTDIFEKEDGKWLMVSHHAQRPPK